MFLTCQRFPRQKTRGIWQGCKKAVPQSLVDIVAERVAKAAGDEFEQSLLQDPLVVIRSAIDAAVAQGSEVQGRIAAKAHEQVGWFEEEWRELLDRSQQFARQTGGGFDLGRVFQDQFGRSTSNAYVTKNERGEYGTMARLVDRLHIEADPTITRDEADQYATSLLVELGALQLGESLDSFKRIPSYREPGEEGPVREPDLHRSGQVKVTGLPTRLPGMTVDVLMRPEHVSPNVNVVMDIPTFQRAFNLKEPQEA